MAGIARWTLAKARAGWASFAGRVDQHAEAFIRAQQLAHNPAAEGAGARNAAAAPTVDFPAFYAFISSRYTVALLLCAALANRIIAVVPPNLQIAYRSSAKTRALVRAPAIFLLARSCVLILAMLSKMSDDQGSQAFYSIKADSLLGQQQASLTHANVLWSCFLAACVAVACESFVRALDRE